MDKVLRIEAVESRNELRQLLFLVLCALEHLVERIDQASDHYNRRFHRNETDNLPNGGDLIVLVVVDQLAFLSMIEYALLRER